MYVWGASCRDDLWMGCFEAEYFVDGMIHVRGIVEGMLHDRGDCGRNAT